MMSGPLHFPAQPLSNHTDQPRHWWINPPRTAAWAGPVFSEWELTAARYSDEHVHDEFVYVLEGELAVEAQAVTVHAAKGDLVCVPGGSVGIYSTSTYARLLSVYAPNAEGVPAKVHGYEVAHRA